MPSRFVSTPNAKLNLGVNLRGLTGGLNMQLGEAMDCMDVLPREDGAIYKHYGWERVNPSALTGRPMAVQGFTYKGKNANTGGGDTARAGNWSIADDDADFTRRQTTWSGEVVLTDTNFYRWDPGTEAFVSVALPTGATIDIDPKPTIISYNNSLYIVGFATRNLRYDPTDQALYLWGWEAVPTAPTNAAQAGGTLITGGVYRYAYTFLDIYTGEESGLSDSVSFTPAGGNNTARLTLTAYSEAAGARHFNTLAVATDTDVAMVVYRTEADREVFNFLDIAFPGDLSVDDVGLSTDASIQPFQGTMQDEPKFNMMTLFRDQFYAVSQTADMGDGVVGRKVPRDSRRVWFNSFHAENSYVERWEVNDFRELPLEEGEVLSAISHTDSRILILAETGGFQMSAQPNYSSGRVDRVHRRLPWHVGAVGAAAIDSNNGWVYFLSERGPYRWTDGLAEPEWIGKNLLPMFIDPTSGLCKLAPSRAKESEVAYDLDANTVRYIFPTGGSAVLNNHIGYWVDGQSFLGTPYAGWFFFSPKAQCFDRAMSVTGPGDDGAPLPPGERKERMLFGDDDGYVNAYELTSKRGGLPAGSLARGTAQASSTQILLEATTAANPLLTQGDGLTGMRLEVVHASGLIETRVIASNTATAIVPTEDFNEIPVLSTSAWFVAGIPAFWRSHVDAVGRPHDRKSMLHLYLTYLLTAIGATPVLDVSVYAGDRTMRLRRTRTAALNDWQQKMLVARSGLYFAYEVANTRPDEMFTITAFEPEYALHGTKRDE